MRLILLAMLLISSSVFASESSRLLCTASGKAGGNDAGPFMVKALLSLEINYSEELGGYLLEGNGEIKLASAYEEVKSPDDLNEDNAYIGKFELFDVEQNTEYRPRRYKNHIQFRNFDAEETTGLESGMWGEFVLHESFASVQAKEKVSAHYIFQAGDHMGGTIHFSCLRL